MNNERELEILHQKYITWFNNQTIHYQNHVYWIILQKILGNAKDLESSHMKFEFDNYSKEKSESNNYQKSDLVKYMLKTRYAKNNRADNNGKPFIYFLYPKKSIKMDEKYIRINRVETISPIWVMPHKNTVSDYNEDKVCSINNQQRWQFNKGLFIIVAINDYYLEIGFNPDILKNFVNLNYNEYISIIGGSDKFCIDEKILNIFEFNGAKHIKYMKIYPLISNELNYTYYAPPILQWENGHPFYPFDANILLKCSDIQPFLKIPEFAVFIKYLLNLNEEKVDEPNSPSNKIDKPYEKIIEKETDKANDKEESIEDCFKKLLSHIDDKDIKIPKDQYMMAAKMLDCIVSKFKEHDDSMKEFDKKFDELFNRFMK